jgi:ABC-type bacteriocin/lantibiotic exporter with double-glycine peptidase domain
MQIKTVIQQEATGCGLASVAMLAGKSYQDIRSKANRLGIFAEDEKLWSDTDHVRRLLKSYKIEAANVETDFTSWEALPNLALLAIKYRLENGRPFWHWTVFQRIGTKQTVHDPAAYLEMNDRDDFHDMQPAWFIKIHTG